MLSAPRSDWRTTNIKPQFCAELFQSPKEQRKQLVMLMGRLVKVKESLAALDPPYSVAITASAQRAITDRDFDLSSFRQDVRQLAIGVSDFLEMFEPPKGNPGNHPLEAAVRVLLPVVEELASGKAMVSLNKHKGASPEPRSKAARVIVAIIRSFEAPPSQTAILNMIIKVQQSPEPSRDTIDAIIAAQDDWLPTGRWDVSPMGENGDEI